MLYYSLIEIFRDLTSISYAPAPNLVLSKDINFVGLMFLPQMACVGSISGESSSNDWKSEHEVSKLDIVVILVVKSFWKTTVTTLADV